MDDDKGKLDIINEVDTLKVIDWVKTTWIEATRNTIKYYFEKCGLPTDHYEAMSLDCDEEFHCLIFCLRI